MTSICKGYAFNFDGHGVFTPDGRAEITDVDAHNKALEQAEIERFKTNPPDHAFLYVRLPKHVLAFCACGQNTATELDRPVIHTWLGTSIASHVYIGPRRYIGFDKWTYRRSVDCRIFGTRYVGWYMESSGDYCRLRKAKRQ